GQCHRDTAIGSLYDRRRFDDCWLLQNDTVERGRRQSFQVELVDLTPDDAKKASAPQDSPSGGKVCLNLKPTKKLVIVIEKKDENGSSTNTTDNFIAEKDGKFVIPVPGPVSNAIIQK